MSLISPVFGALFGTQKGREIEISNSFEMLMLSLDGIPTIDQDYFAQKTAQFKEVFPSLELLGWYSTVSTLSPMHYIVQKQMMGLMDLPLLLVLEPNPPPTVTDLPLRLYEAFVEVAGLEQQVHFVPMACDVATEEAERIGVEHVAQMSTSGVGLSSEATAHLVGQFNAISMLHTRVAALRSYVAAAAEGRVPANRACLRAVRSVLSRLPLVSGTAFQNETTKETNDALLMAYLATLTKGCHAVNELIDHVGVLRHFRLQ